MINEDTRTEQSHWIFGGEKENHFLLFFWRIGLSNTPFNSNSFSLFLPFFCRLLTFWYFRIKILEREYVRLLLIHPFAEEKKIQELEQMDGGADDKKPLTES